MAGLALGATALAKVALGSVEIEKISIGSTELWAASHPVSSMKMNRTTPQNLATQSVYEKIVNMVAVTGTHPATVIVDNELQADGDGTWDLAVAITHSNTSSGTGVRVSRKRLGEGGYTVLQTFSTSGTFHTSVSGTITGVAVLAGDLYRVEAMHANFSMRDITTTTLTATAV
ncbi:hypothetical protein AAI421_18155 [Rhodococcus aetherivorans]|uniref:hypothetical protein n=1 Tax=Rhodococcus aetherivorans TaxID=191292 RepID=UPI0031E1FCAD